MRIRSCVAAAGCLFGITLSAQTRPDFAGRWIAVEPAAVVGHELRIVQDAQTLKLEQVRLDSQAFADTLGRVRGPGEGERESTNYRIDGQPTIARLSHHDSRQVRSTLIWNDAHQARLLDVYPDMHARFERTLTLDTKGRLILEHRRPATSSDDPGAASADIAKPRRIVFERR